MSALDRMPGTSPAFQEVINAARVVAATDITLLICGETGTGKEVLARAVHDHSPRGDGPFLALNCASLNEPLADSLLFGHRKGAFTGAEADHLGAVRAARGGTLLLDEVGELPLTTQAKLLRFLECGECLPLGEVRPLPVDVRVIAATNRELAAEVAAGRFRRDLYYRLCIVPLVLPPLRERREDIPMLLDHFVAQAAARFGKPAPRFDRSALRVLRDYAWPGNLRELRNLAERCVILLGGSTIGADNLPVEVRARGAEPGALAMTLPEGGIVMEQLEADIIRQALARTAGNRSRAARLLGMSRDTLLYRMKKHAIG